MDVVTISYRLGVLGTQLHRARRFGLGQSLLPFAGFSSLPSTTGWGFWVSKYTELGGFGLGQSLLPFVRRLVIVTNNYRLGVLGKQLHRARRFWAGSKFAAFHRVVVVTINYRLGVLGKQLHRAQRFWAGSKLATFHRVVVINIYYRLGVLGKQLHRPAVLVWV